MLGPERPLLLSRDDRERIAYHESGHAILGLVVPGADPVHRVTIVPRGQALGVTYQRPQTDRYNYPEAYLRAKIVGMLGGRAAEEIVYGTKTTGAESDIEQATNLARNMVTRWGMSDKLGMVQLAPRQNEYLGGGVASRREAVQRGRRAMPVDAEAAENHTKSAMPRGDRLLTAHRKGTLRCAGHPRALSLRERFRAGAGNSRGDRSFPRAPEPLATRFRWSKSRPTVDASQVDKHLDDAVFGRNARL
jgi:cell division protease FtsH